jgi:hypothetical protein
MSKTNDTSKLSRAILASEASKFSRAILENRDVVADGDLDAVTGGKRPAGWYT